MQEMIMSTKLRLTMERVIEAYQSDNSRDVDGICKQFFKNGMFDRCISYIKEIEDDSDKCREFFDTFYVITGSHFDTFIYHLQKRYNIRDINLLYFTVKNAITDVEYGVLEHNHEKIDDNMCKLETFINDCKLQLLDTYEINQMLDDIMRCESLIHLYYPSCHKRFKSIREKFKMNNPLNKLSALK